MRWNIIVECVGEDGKRFSITLGTIERLAGSTTAENLGVNLQESKQIANRLQDTIVKQQLHEHCEQRRKCLTCWQAAAGQRLPLQTAGYHPGDPYSSGFRDIEVVSAAPARRFGARFRKSSRGE